MLCLNNDLWSDSDIRAKKNRKDIQAKIEEEAEWRNGDAPDVSDDEGEEEEEKDEEEEEEEVEEMVLMVDYG